MDDMVALLLIIITIYIAIYTYKKVMKIVKKREEVLQKENFTDNFRCSIHSYNYIAFKNNSFYFIDFLKFSNNKPIIYEIEKIWIKGTSIKMTFKNNNSHNCSLEDGNKYDDFNIWYNDRKIKENTNQS